MASSTVNEHVLPMSKEGIRVTRNLALLLNKTCSTTGGRGAAILLTKLQRG